MNLLSYLRKSNNTKFIMLTGCDDYNLQKEVEKKEIFIEKTTSNLINTIIKILEL